eukprot:TRINITY_DN4331_c1_g1_i1.p2 TRINITY_DN4331_c1_g1~~TRINITY_DN4331_c1_g1_i1.p2  ORF type:complete len:213 (-),score=36.59 TRINITY_DN4331_c1_g1_i1:309-947(-)
MNRLAAFVKRLGGVALHGNLKEILGSFSLIYRLLLRYHKLRRLIDFEEANVGQIPFNPDARDPGQANALSTTLCELRLLQTHFNPTIRSCSSWVIEQFQENVVQRQGSRGQVLAGGMGPIEIVEQSEDMKGMFDSVAEQYIKLSQNKKKRKNFVEQSILDELVVEDEDDDPDEVLNMFELYFHRTWQQAQQNFQKGKGTQRNMNGWRTKVKQ